jgi:AAA domain
MEEPTRPLLGYIAKFKDFVKEPPVASLYYPDNEAGCAQAESFVRREDAKGYSIYSCIGRLHSRPRNRDNVAELSCLILDLDLRNMMEGREQVLDCLHQLIIPPDQIDDSGGGLHPVWHFKEPLTDEAGMVQAEAVMHRLVRLLAGDPNPTHRAALLRHVGSHNSRYGDWHECRVIESTGKRCDISEFEDMFDLYGEQPLLHVKPKANGNGQGNFTDWAATPGEQVHSTDIEAMRYQGKPSMNEVFHAHMGSSLSKGDTVAATIERIVEAAERNCRDDPNRPRWRNNLAERAGWWLEKHPEWLCTALNRKLYDKWNETKAEGTRRPSLVWRDGAGLEVRRYKTQHEPRTEQTNTEQTNTEQTNTEQTNTEQTNTGAAPPHICTKLVEWLDRDIPEPDFLLGEVFHTCSRALLVATTGLGKTMFAVALGLYMASGEGFLCWPARRPCRVLFIDGEMSSRLLKSRLRGEVERSGIKPDTFFALSHEDLAPFEPLNTPGGQGKIEQVIRDIGGVDFIHFDNVMSLIAGDMKDEEGWRQTQAWQHSLTRRSIGQMWIHHTGHDETRSYGTKTKEWQMDTVLFMERLERPDTDISFTLTFRKARERTPTTRAQFDDAAITLVNDKWQHSPAEGGVKARQISDMAMAFLRALIDVLAGPDVVKRSGRRCVTNAAWKRECSRAGLMASGDRADETLFYRQRRELIAARRVAGEDELTWLL